MRTALLALLGYAIGAIPFSFLVARLFGVSDVRKVGSGNVGATNVMRSAGKVPGVIALVLDGLKGAGTVWIVRALGASEVEACAAGLAAVAGHLFPIWLGFRGGKGVATGAGLFIPLAPQALGVAVVFFAGALAAFRYVSLASMIASLALAGATWALGFSRAVTVTATLAALAVVAKHHANLDRLRRGVEPRLGAKK